MIPEAGKGTCVGGVYSGGQREVTLMDACARYFYAEFERPIFCLIWTEEETEAQKRSASFTRPEGVGVPGPGPAAPSGKAATYADGAGLGSRSRALPVQYLYFSLALNGPVCEQEASIAPTD